MYKFSLFCDWIHGLVLCPFICLCPLVLVDSYLFHYLTCILQSRLPLNVKCWYSNYLQPFTIFFPLFLLVHALFWIMSCMHWFALFNMQSYLPLQGRPFSYFKKCYLADFVTLCSWIELCVIAYIAGLSIGHWWIGENGTNLKTLPWRIPLRHDLPASEFEPFTFIFLRSICQKVP